MSEDIRRQYVNLLGSPTGKEQRLVGLRALHDVANECRESFWAMLIEARIAEEDGNSRLAVDLSDTLIANPQAPKELTLWATLNRGSALGTGGDPQKEIADYTAIIDDPLAPSDLKVVARVCRGNALGKNGDVEGAFKDQTAVIDDQSAPTDQRAMARIFRGLIARGRGDVDGALADFNGVVEDYAVSPGLRNIARVHRGAVLEETKKVQEAIQDYTAAISDTTTAPELAASLRLVRGALLLQIGALDGAIADLTAVIDDPGTNPDRKAKVRLKRAEAYRQKNEWDAAVADYAAIMDDSDAPWEAKFEASCYHGAILAARNEPDKALAGYRAAFSDTRIPPILRAYALSAWMLLSQDRTGKAYAASANLVVGFGADTVTDFVAKLHAERERKREFFSESRFESTNSFLLVAREWNSFTPAIPGLGEPSRGGGYYLRHRGVGVVIDPGFDFLQIFEGAGGRLCDIDHIVLTHAHNDHTAEFEAILTLLYANNHPAAEEPSRGQRRVNVYLSQGAARKFAGFLPLRECGHIGEVVTLNRGRSDGPQVIALSDGISLTVLPAYHDDVLTRDYSVGLGFQLAFPEGAIRRIVFTGDTALFPELGPATDLPPKSVFQVYSAPYRREDGVDLLIAHIGTITEADLREGLGIANLPTQEFIPVIPFRPEPPRDRRPQNGTRTEGQNHLRLSGVFSVVYGLQPKAAIVSEFGEELKPIWIKAVRALETQLGAARPDGPRIPVFAGDPVLIYDIEGNRFLCHEDQQFRKPEELRMVGVHETRKGHRPGPTRPYLFLSKFDDESDYEDRVEEFHRKLDRHDLPHFKRKPV
jgi:tetratricopeptide (TPR) repeat protein